MASSEVQICSNALLLLGDDPINAFTENSNRARLCANLWANSRDSVLRSHPWNCAIARVALAPDTEVPAFDYSAQFSLPGDWLRTLSIGEEGDSVQYKQEGRKILCDEGVLNLRYIYRNEDVASWDSGLVEAMTAYMAWRMAYAITKSHTAVEERRAEYQALARMARTVDGQEDIPDDPTDFPLIAVRY